MEKKNNVLKVVGIFLVILLMVGIFIFTTRSEEKPFNEVQLSDKNTIVNNIYPKYFDTILSVALDQAGIENQILVFDKLSDGAKSQFDGSLKAHIRNYNNIFYIFIDEMDKSEAITVLSHEVVHVKQYVSGDLIYDNGWIVWKDQTLTLDEVSYENRGWEIEAFDQEGQIANQVQKILWEK